MNVATPYADQSYVMNGPASMTGGSDDSVDMNHGTAGPGPAGGMVINGVAGGYGSHNNTMVMVGDGDTSGSYASFGDNNIMFQQQFPLYRQAIMQPPPPIMITAASISQSSGVRLMKLGVPASSQQQQPAFGKMLSLNNNGHVVVPADTQTIAPAATVKTSGSPAVTSATEASRRAKEAWTKQIIQSGSAARGGGWGEGLTEGGMMMIEGVQGAEGEDDDEHHHEYSRHDDVSYENGKIQKNLTVHVGNKVSDNGAGSVVSSDSSSSRGGGGRLNKSLFSPRTQAALLSDKCNVVTCEAFSGDGSDTEVSVQGSGGGSSEKPADGESGGSGDSGDSDVSSGARAGAGGRADDKYAEAEKTLPLRAVAKSWTPNTNATAFTPSTPVTTTLTWNRIDDEGRNSSNASTPVRDGSAITNIAGEADAGLLEDDVSLIKAGGEAECFSADKAAAVVVAKLDAESGQTANNDDVAACMDTEEAVSPQPPSSKPFTPKASAPVFVPKVTALAFVPSAGAAAFVPRVIAPAFVPGATRSTTVVDEEVEQHVYGEEGNYYDKCDNTLYDDDDDDEGGGGDYDAYDDDDVSFEGGGPIGIANPYNFCDPDDALKAHNTSSSLKKANVTVPVFAPKASAPVWALQADCPPAAAGSSPKISVKEATLAYPAVKRKELEVKAGWSIKPKSIASSISALTLTSTSTSNSTSTSTIRSGTSAGNTGKAISASSITKELGWELEAIPAAPAHLVNREELSSEERQKKASAVKAGWGIKPTTSTPTTATRTTTSTTATTEKRDGTMDEQAKKASAVKASWGMKPAAVTSSFRVAVTNSGKNESTVEEKNTKVNGNTRKAGGETRTVPIYTTTGTTATTSAALNTFSSGKADHREMTVKESTGSSSSDSKERKEGIPMSNVEGKEGKAKGKSKDQSNDYVQHNTAAAMAASEANNERGRTKERSSTPQRQTGGAGGAGGGSSGMGSSFLSVTPPSSPDARKHRNDDDDDDDVGQHRQQHLGGGYFSPSPPSSPNFHMARLMMKEGAGARGGGGDDVIAEDAGNEEEDDVMALDGVTEGGMPRAIGCGGDGGGTKTKTYTKSSSSRSWEGRGGGDGGGARDGGGAKVLPPSAPAAIAAPAAKPAASGWKSKDGGGRSAGNTQIGNQSVTLLSSCKAKSAGKDTLASSLSALSLPWSGTPTDTTTQTAATAAATNTTTHTSAAATGDVAQTEVTGILKRDQGGASKRNSSDGSSSSSSSGGGVSAYRSAEEDEKAAVVVSVAVRKEAETAAAVVVSRWATEGAATGMAEAEQKTVLPTATSSAAKVTVTARTSPSTSPSTSSSTATAISSAVVVRKPKEVEEVVVSSLTTVTDFKQHADKLNNAINRNLKDLSNIYLQQQAKIDGELLMMESRRVEADRACQAREEACGNDLKARVEAAEELLMMKITAVDEEIRLKKVAAEEEIRLMKLTAAEEVCIMKEELIAERSLWESEKEKMKNVQVVEEEVHVKKEKLMAEQALWEAEKEKIKHIRNLLGASRLSLAGIGI